MTKRKTATAEKQPDLLGTEKQEAIAKPATSKGEVAKVEKPQTQRAWRSAQDRAQARPGDLLVMLDKVIANPNVPVEKLQVMMDMQEKLEAEAARRSFNAAFRELQRKLPVIRPDGKIEIEPKPGARIQRKQETKFASYPNIMLAVLPHLDAHGFSVWHSTEPNADGTRLIVSTYLEHDDGHRRSTAFPLPSAQSGSQNTAQGWGASQSYGKRYGLMALLALISHASEDRDLDGPTGKGHAQDVVDGEAVSLITQEQADKIVEALEALGRSHAAFCKPWKIDKVVDLPAEHYERAMAALKRLMNEAKNG